MPHQRRSTQATAYPLPRARADLASFPTSCSMTRAWGPPLHPCWPVDWALLQDRSVRHFGAKPDQKICRRSGGDAEFMEDPLHGRLNGIVVEIDGLWIELGIAA